MRELLTCLAIASLIFTTGCGGEDKADDAGSAPDTGAVKDAGDAAKDNAENAADTAKKAVEGAGKADVNYKCSCGKEKSAPAGAAPPS